MEKIAMTPLPPPLLNTIPALLFLLGLQTSEKGTGKIPHAGRFQSYQLLCLGPINSGQMRPPRLA
jgi:hypothetical protein